MTLNIYVFSISALSILLSLFAIYSIFSKRAKNDELENELKERTIKIFDEFKINLEKSISDNKKTVEGELQHFENLLKNINLGLANSEKSLKSVIDESFYFKKKIDEFSIELEDLNKKLNNIIKQKDAKFYRVKNKLKRLKNGI